MADFERIRQNIGRMIEKGAPESDIEAYVSSEGVSADQIRASAMQGPPASMMQKPKPYVGSILPFTKGEDGKVRFDSNAGILGTVKRAVTLPGDVYTGKVDPASDEALHRSMDLAGIASPISPATRAAGQALPGMAPRMTSDKSIAPPSAEALQRAGSAGYDAVRDMGVDYSSSAVANLARGLQQNLESKGILAELAPKTHSLAGKLADAPPGSVAPIAGLEAARRAAGHAAKDFGNPTEQLAAKQLQRAIDEFMGAADPATVVAGPASQAARELAAARGNTAAAKRSERITGVGEAAELRAAAANSGQNLDNSIRSRVASLLLDPKKAAGYSPEELAALQSISEGTAGRNAARFVGNLLGGGGGLGQSMTTLGVGAGGMATMGPMGALAGAAVPVIGMAAKSTGNKLTSRALEKADDLVRSRSPLHEEAIQNAPKVLSGDVAATDALIRALLSSQGAGQAAVEGGNDIRSKLVRSLLQSQGAPAAP